LAKRLGNLELQLRAELEVGVLADTTGDRAEVMRIAGEVKRRASLARYARLERHADDMLAGKDAFAEWRAQAKEFQDEDAIDDRMANLSSVELLAMARSGCETLGIPYSRAENLLSSGTAEKVLAAARRDWCRYMRHVEHSDHEQSVLTMFATPTPKRIICSKLGRESAFPHSDGAALVAAFKRAHCVDCQARNPRKGAS